MLRHGGEALVQQELEAVMIRADQKVTPPQVWPPVADGLDEPDQLTFISRELEMTCSERPNASQSMVNCFAKSGIWSTGPVDRAR